MYNESTGLQVLVAGVMLSAGQNNGDGGSGGGGGSGASGVLANASNAAANTLASTGSDTLAMVIVAFGLVAAGLLLSRVAIQLSHR